MPALNIPLQWHNCCDNIKSKFIWSNNCVNHNIKYYVCNCSSSAAASCLVLWRACRRMPVATDTLRESNPSGRCLTGGMVNMCSHSLSTAFLIPWPSFPVRFWTVTKVWPNINGTFVGHSTIGLSKWNTTMSIWLGLVLQARLASIFTSMYDDAIWKMESR